MIITEVFGPAWKLQNPSLPFSIPMKTGTAYAELLARALPLDAYGNMVLNSDRF
jgi:hypothetical protein